MNDSNVTNNNVVDSLNVLLKDEQSKASDLSNAHDIISFDSNDEIKTDSNQETCTVGDLMEKLDDLSDEKSKMEEKLKVDDLLKSNTEQSKSEDLLTADNLLESESKEEKIQTTEELSTNIDRSENEIKTTDLLIEQSDQIKADETATLIEQFSNKDSNTSNTIASIDPVQQNLTFDTSLEQSRDQAALSAINSMIEDCSVKETEINNSSQNITIDTNQDLNESTQENILDRIDLTNDSINETKNTTIDLADQSTKETNLVDMSIDSLTNQSASQQAVDLINDSKKEISLMEISDDNQTVQQEASKCSALLDPSNQSSIESTVKNVSTESTDTSFFKTMNSHLNKTVDEFLDEIKPAESIANSTETPTNQQTLEDFVIKNEDETKPEEIDMIRSETFILHKTQDSQASEENEEAKNPLKQTCELFKPSTEQLATKLENLTVEETIKTEDDIVKIEEKTEEPTKEVVVESTSQEPESSKSKDDIFTQSQEYLKQADKLIAEKKNQINDINIPGLDVPSADKSIPQQTTTASTEQSPESVKKTETSVEQEQIDKENPTKNKQNNLRNKCVIS